MVSQCREITYNATTFSGFSGTILLNCVNRPAIRTRLVSLLILRRSMGQVSEVSTPKNKRNRNPRRGTWLNCVATYGKCESCSGNVGVVDLTHAFQDSFLHLSLSFLLFSFFLLFLFFSLFPSSSLFNIHFEISVDFTLGSSWNGPLKEEGFKCR